MCYDNFKKWFFRLGERTPRRPIRLPKKAPSVAVSAEPAEPAEPEWLKVIHEVNKAITILEKNGAKLKGYRVRVPPKAIADMNNRIEAQLLRLGIPAHIHNVLASTLTAYVFSKEIEEKALQTALKSGIIDQDSDDDLTDEQLRKIQDLEARFNLQMFCRLIGVEPSNEEIEQVIQDTKRWEKGE